VIGPKVPRPSKAQERAAYQAATTRDDDRCVRCGVFGVQRDHRKNRSQGGLTVPENIQCLCPDCHLFKTLSPAAAVLEGFAVPGWAHPELWPAYRHNTGWVIYEGTGFRVITETTADLLMGGAADGVVQD